MTEKQTTRGGFVWPQGLIDGRCPRTEVRHCVTFHVRHYECRLDLPPLPWRLSNRRRGRPRNFSSARKIAHCPTTGCSFHAFHRERHVDPRYRRKSDFWRLVNRRCALKSRFSGSVETEEKQARGCIGYKYTPRATVGSQIDK